QWRVHVARFFKYKSAAELLAENARLGTDLRLSDDLSPLFAPLTIGGRTAGNRWCIHPMEGCDGEPDGRPGELTFRRYVRFGDGGRGIAPPDPLLVGRYKVTADTPLVTDDELKRLPEQYAATAKLAAEVGFDFVDVKQCHRYLLNELLGARNRPGPYGGSYEN